MSVETILKKICDHNKVVLGCIASHGESVYQELPEMYAMIDADGVREHAENVFTLMDGLESGEGAFDQMFMEFPNHSIAARRLEDGVLVLIAEPISRAEFKRTQIGVNLFLKPLRRALDQPGERVERVVRVQEQAEETRKPGVTKHRRMYRGVEY